MMHHWRRLMCLALCFGLMSLWSARSASAEPAASAPGPVTVSIYNTGDLHEQTGNLPRIAYIIKQRKAEDRNVLFVDAGDRYNRGELPIIYTRGEAMTAIMAACGYDLCAMGNHDFTFGAARMLALAKQFALPIHIANCQWVQDRRPKDIPAYHIFKLKGVKVAVIGSASQWMHVRTASLTKLTPLIETLQELVPELRKKADIIVLVSHHGTDHDKSVAKAVAGIDLIVGAHDHALFREMVYDAESETVIQHSGASGNMIGEVVFEWDGEKIVGRKIRIIDIKADMPEDPKAKAVRERYIKALSADAPLATVPEPLTRQGLTRWLAEAAGQYADADVVLIGAELASQDIPAGEITPRALLGAVPRVEVVRFGVDGANNMDLLLEHIHQVSPSVIAHVRSEPAEGATIRVAYPCVGYFDVLNRKTVGLDSPLVADLERLRDRSLWQIAVEAAREQKALAVPAPPEPAAVRD